MHALLSVACFAGLRQGEILALRWQDIDFEMGIIRVVRSYNPYYGMMDLKTPSSIRTVPMIPRLISTLKELRKESGTPAPEELLFKSPEGNPINRDTLVSKDFEETLKRAGVKRVRFHDLRHTYASLCISAGMDPKALQHAMGHSSIATTMNIYAHLFPGSYDGAISRLDSKFSSG